MELKGADIVVQCLAEEGVDHVFGYPGGAVLYIYDAIYKQDKFQHILVRHEQAAVHAADAYSRRSEEHTSELQSLMRSSYAVFCLKKKKTETKGQHKHYLMTKKHY